MTVCVNGSLREFNLVQSAVWQTFQSTLSKTDKEPQLIADFICTFVSEIKKINLPTIKAGGVFVHAQPFVKCKNFPLSKPASVEIGDLLIIRNSISNGVTVERRAMLLQAKKTKLIPTKPDNQNQFHLYSHWPLFHYVRSGKLSNKKRKIEGLDVHSATKYLLINEGSGHLPTFKYQWCNPVMPNDKWMFSATPVGGELGNYRDFGNELVSFIFGNAGKVFVQPAKRSRGWDKVINDLISETAKKTSRFMKHSTGKRGMHLFCIGDFNAACEFKKVSAKYKLKWGENDLPPQTPEVGETAEDEGGGISVIEITVDAKMLENS